MKDIILYNILNSIDNTLENTSKLYNNSFADNFIDRLKNRINNIDNLELIKENDMFSLDRYEGNFAICENISSGEIFNIPKEKIDSKAKNGNILIFKNGLFKIDYTKTTQRIDYINKITNNIFEK